MSKYEIINGLIEFFESQQRITNSSPHKDSRFDHDLKFSAICYESQLAPGPLVKGLWHWSGKYFDEPTLLS